MSRRASSQLLALLRAPAARRPSSPYRPAALSRPLAHSPRPLQQFTSPGSAPPAPTPREASANAAQVSHELSPSDESQPLRDLSDGLADGSSSSRSTAPSPNNSTILADDGSKVDWTRSFHGLSSTPFTAEQAAILQQPIPSADIEVKPDGIIYLPEIKYRRILNAAFGPGGWGLAPRGETIVTGKVVTREYGLVCGGRLVSVARGEQAYFDPDGIPTATEGCKSNALMRCCKDLGVASELWDPRFVRGFMREHARETLVEHAVTRKRRRHYMRADDEVRYPFKEVAGPAAGGSSAAASSAPAAKAPAATGKAGAQQAVKK